MRGRPPRRKKRQFSFPWWVIIPTWILLWVTTLVSIAFVTFYGIMFGQYSLANSES